MTARHLLAVAATLAAATAATAQPGRTFTPPPPVFTPPPTFTPPPQNFGMQNVRSMQETAARMQSDASNRSTQAYLDRTQSQTRMQMESDSQRRTTSSGSSWSGGFDLDAELPRPPRVCVVFTGVNADGQCAGLGVKPGDLLVSYAGVPVYRELQLHQLISEQVRAGGGAVSLVVNRAGQDMAFDVQPGRLGVMPRERLPR